MSDSNKPRIIMNPVKAPVPVYGKDSVPVRPPEPGQYINLTEAFDDFEFDVSDIHGIIHSWVSRLSCEWCGEEPNTVLLTDAGVQTFCKDHVEVAMKAGNMFKIDLEEGPDGPQ